MDDDGCKFQYCKIPQILQACISLEATIKGRRSIKSSYISKISKNASSCTNAWF